MEPNDGLPSSICCACSDKLEAAYKFKLQVEQADSVLRERLDSLNMKEDLFFTDEDVNLSSHRNDVGEITDESLLLKDHMDLLNVQKISEGEDELQSVQKKECDMDMQQQVENQKEEEVEQELNENEQIHIQGDEEQMQEIECEQQLEIQEDKDLQEMHNEQHNQSFGAQELQEIMFNEINNQEEMQEELNQSHQLAMHEHNYVVESQATCDITSENDTLILEVSNNPYLFYFSISFKINICFTFYIRKWNKIMKWSRIVKKI